MAYRKKTLRSMSPTTRKVARLIGELGSIEKRLRNLIPEIQEIESRSNALTNAKAKGWAKIEGGEKLFDKVKVERIAETGEVVVTPL